MDIRRHGDCSTCACRAGVCDGCGSCDEGSLGLTKGFVPLSEVIPRPTRLSRLSAFDAPNVRAPTLEQMAPQSVSEGSSMTGVTGRKAEGEETVRGSDRRAIRRCDTLREVVRCPGIECIPFGNLTLAEGFVEIRNGCTPLRSACSLSSSSPRCIIAVAGRAPCW